ncbi:hypothetical protein M514_00559 [Trichuris suis]|uniref:Uncharacterized protein n=1 Tax=Trichuris suis TaxID=68888 RepID=A0A085NDA7_9BILA|nr:hypothetical protein M513_00559 [Trichuris suis]KFD67453.1 hypothetical protein M514_00559 [Trichuris suis]
MYRLEMVACSYCARACYHLEAHLPVVIFMNSRKSCQIGVEIGHAFLHAFLTCIYCVDISLWFRVKLLMLLDERALSCPVELPDYHSNKLWQHPAKHT